MNPDLESLLEMPEKFWEEISKKARELRIESEDAPQLSKVFNGSAIANLRKTFQKYSEPEALHFESANIAELPTEEPVFQDSDDFYVDISSSDEESQEVLEHSADSSDEVCPEVWNRVTKSLG